MTVTTLDTFPIDVKRFIVETLRLPLPAKAAYLMLILDYCANGKPLPDDDLVLASVTQTSDWPTLRPYVAELFDIRDGRWHHAEIDAEIERVAKVQANAANASLKAAEKRSADAQGRKARGPDLTPITPITPEIERAFRETMRPLAEFERPASTTTYIGKPPAPAAPIDPPAPELYAEPIPENFRLTGEDVIRAQNAGADIDELSEWLNYFGDYHTKASTMSDDWPTLWWRFFDRKMEAKNKTAAPKGKPRVELTNRRAPAPPSQDGA